jgi:hypothetical protein
MKMLKMCLNWKVLAGLAATGVGVYLVAPDLVLAALPILLLAACPLSMLLMMWGMQHAQGQGHQTREERIAGLNRSERAALADQLGMLEREEAHPAENAENGRGR